MPPNRYKTFAYIHKHDIKIIIVFSNLVVIPLTLKVMHTKRKDLEMKNLCRTIVFGTAMAFILVAAGSFYNEAGCGEHPTSEHPKAVEPKAESPKVTEPKAESPPPEDPEADEHSTIEHPKAEHPKTEESKGSQPSSEHPE